MKTREFASRASATEAQMDGQENNYRIADLNPESGHGSWVSAMNIFHEDLNILNKELAENDTIHSKINQVHPLLSFSFGLTAC